MPGLWPWLMFECFRRFLLAQNITWIATVTLMTVVAVHCFNTWFLSLHLGWGLNGAAISVAMAYWLQLLIAAALFYARSRFARAYAAQEYQLTRTASPPPENNDTPPRSASPGLVRGSASTGSLQDLSSPQDSTFMTAALPSDSSLVVDTWPPLSADILRGWFVISLARIRHVI